MQCVSVECDQQKERTLLSLTRRTNLVLFVFFCLCFFQIFPPSFDMNLYFHRLWTFGQSLFKFSSANNRVPSTSKYSSNHDSSKSTFSSSFRSRIQLSSLFFLFSFPICSFKAESHSFNLTFLFHLSLPIHLFSLLFSLFPVSQSFM